MRVLNTTHFDTCRLSEWFHRYAEGWPHERLVAGVRYSRGADFSGTCLYGKRTIYVNIRRRLALPYPMDTHIARAQSDETYWWKETYTVHLADGYQVVLFVFLHEFFHWLIGRGRTPGCPGAPAQIRTSGIAAYGSYFGYLAQNRSLGYGCSIRALGIHLSASRPKRFQVSRCL